MCPSDNGWITCDAENALTNKGIQPKAFMKMIDKLAGSRNDDHDYFANNIIYE